MEVSGTFNVELKPINTHAQSANSVKLGRMSIDKVFHGPLTAKSQGEMISAHTQVQGSAGYVAIELVAGSLNGKNGGFALQHFGLMAKGEQSLILDVIPDSGSEELEGLTGEMQIKIEDGQHFYTFNYELPEPQTE